MINKTKRKGNYGHKHSEATKQKIRDARAKQISKPHSEETKRKIGNANKGKTPYNKGKTGLQHHTKETMIKLSKLLEERWKDPLQREKLSKINLGRVRSDEEKLKRSITMKKVRATPEYKLAQHNGMLGLQNALGTKQSKETIAKRMKTMKPIFNSESYKAKLREKRLHQIFPQKDTKPEKMLQVFLDLNHIKYRTHEPILGQPDIFIEPNICIFMDGCYFHGCQKCHPHLHKKYPQIERQMLRDTDVTHKLIEKGYLVLRYWEHSIVPEIDNDGLLHILKEQEVYHGF